MDHFAGNPEYLGTGSEYEQKHNDVGLSAESGKLDEFANDPGPFINWEQAWEDGLTCRRLKPFTKFDK